MKNDILIEVVINNSLDDVKKAMSMQIDRIELVQGVEISGLTANINTLKEIKKIYPNLKIASMVRPRMGNFIYNENEFSIMKKDAILLLENGSDAIVFGCLNENNDINENQMKELIDLSHKYNKEAVCHKAIDSTQDINKNIEILVNLGIDRILTNGKAKNDDLSDGCEYLNLIKEKYPNVQFLLGGGINSKTVKKALDISKLKQIHLTAKQVLSDGHISLDENELYKVIQEL